ncbi:hypothetical protein PO878_16535 [Iamia majanohamensis]|uniref:Uncharacterized protein n=1 Tax=Iamia majanohamensis TaxID=467976 RepID=A0AAE9Y4F2_9ACTN|nr:hypothetical protein [Iamia majanohamensis]WCO66109.1 hypothetical protein PO878_16535 [Iamia majanohamensis]
MYIEGRNGVSLALSPVGYQFPAPATDSWHDLNWLVIEGAIASPDGDWRFREPCLLTDEAVRLGAWLGRVSAGAIAPPGPDPEGCRWPDLSFTEPNIALAVRSHVGDDVVLRVHLSLESAPPWLDEEVRLPLHFWVDCRSSRQDLALASRAWMAEIAEYPVRNPS